MDLIETGKIVNTHGIKGDIKAVLWTSDIESLLEVKELFIDGKPYAVDAARLHGDNILFRLHGVDTPEAAEKFRNRIISVPRDTFSLDEGEYFISDLIGISVYDADTGKFYGEISDVLQPGANDVYELAERTEDGKTVKRYIPAIKDCIVSTDIKGKTMKIRPLEGLFDL